MGYYLSNDLNFSFGEITVSSYFIQMVLHIIYGNIYVYCKPPLSSAREKVDFQIPENSGTGRTIYPNY